MDYFEMAEIARSNDMIQNAKRLFDEHCEPCGAVPLIIQKPAHGGTWYVECPQCKRRTPESACPHEAITAWRHDQTHPFGAPAPQQAIAA